MGRKPQAAASVSASLLDYSLRPLASLLPYARNARTQPGDLVYEPFSGSGTTIIACEQNQRGCRAIELSPAYVDVAVLRWQAFTGEQATLEKTGETFMETARERGVEVG